MDPWADLVGRSFRGFFPTVKTRHEEEEHHGSQRDETAPVAFSQRPPQGVVEHSVEGAQLEEGGIDNDLPKDLASLSGFVQLVECLAHLAPAPGDEGGGERYRDRQ